MNICMFVGLLYSKANTYHSCKRKKIVRRLRYMLLLCCIVIFSRRRLGTYAPISAGVDKRLRRLPSKQKKWVRFPPPAVTSSVFNDVEHSYSRETVCIQGRGKCSTRIRKRTYEKRIDEEVFLFGDTRIQKSQRIGEKIYICSLSDLNRELE